MNLNSKIENQKRGGKDTTPLSEIKEYVEGGVREYVALLTQTGTDAPVAVVLENTLGGDLVWTRDGTGNYFGTLLNAFIGYTNIENINRSTFTRLISDDGTGPVGRGYWMFKGSINAVYLKTTSDIETYDDGILTQTYIKIEVYP